MEGFAQALARRASDRETLLARPRKLLVPDDRTGLLSSPGTKSRNKRVTKISSNMAYNSLAELMVEFN